MPLSADAVPFLPPSSSSASPAPATKAASGDVDATERRSREKVRQTRAERKENPGGDHLRRRERQRTRRQRGGRGGGGADRKWSDEPARNHCLRAVEGDNSQDHLSCEKRAIPTSTLDAGPGHQSKLVKDRHEQRRQRRQGGRRKHKSEKGESGKIILERVNYHQTESEIATRVATSGRDSQRPDGEQQPRGASNNNTHHRKHRGKRRSNRRQTGANAAGHEHVKGEGQDSRVPTPDYNIHEEDGHDLNVKNEASFPTLPNAFDASEDKTPVIDAKQSNVLVSGFSWNTENLAGRLAHSLEVEREHQRQEQQRIQREKDRDQSLQLTMLSSRASHKRDGKPNGMTSENTLARDDDEGESMPSASPATEPSTQPQSIHHDGDHQSTMIPNTKSRWSDADLSKMRRRWWDAVRAKRKKCEEDRKKKREERSQLEKIKGTITPAIATGDDDGYCSLGGEDSSSGTSSSLSSSSSAASSDEESLAEAIYRDPMQPPSLSTPFDEMPSFDAHASAAAKSAKLPQLHESSTVPQSILDLEQTCLDSTYPLHYAVYSHSLGHDTGVVSWNGDAENHEQSESEVVLHRLLSMQNQNDVMSWKRARVGLTQLHEMEANNDQHAKETSDVTVNLLSADATSLTPLLLAIYWNLPIMVRLLYPTVWPSGPKNEHNKDGEEDDEHGRTPLMLACELGHVACIRAILRVCSLKKLDRRERRGGNTAYHFCCMGTLSNTNLPGGGMDGGVGGSEGEPLGDYAARAMPSTACVEAIDGLLRHTPASLQKRVMMLTNCEGQNIFHLACSRGDMKLVERILNQRNAAPGVKISKALDAKDRFGYTPFLTAVAADATEIVVHLLTSRFAAGPNFCTWFAGCPLIVAASKFLVDMINILLGIAYDASISYSPARKLPGIGLTVHSEANRALLETIYCMTEDEEGKGPSEIETHEIIRLLICQGGANPHLPVSVRFPGKPQTRGDTMLSHTKGKMSLEDTPLLAAVRAADAELVRCIIDAYSGALGKLKAQRRNDPLLRSQPESYFQLLEEKEDDVVYSSVDAALVVSLFLLQDENHSSFGRCSLVLYQRGRSNLSSIEVPRNPFSQRAMMWLQNCFLKSMVVPPPLLKNDAMESYIFEMLLVQYHIPISIDLKKKALDKIPYHNAGADYMDWSYVLAKLPWLCSRTNGMNCSLLQGIISDSSDRMKRVLTSEVSEDEFFLCVGGEQLLAHKSIVSAKSGKLAAQIRFTEAHARESPLLVHVDHISSHMLKILLCHCYHGSIAFGLMKCPLKRCQQLLELALMADEYLCPSLLMECEIRLMVQSSTSAAKVGSLCICPQCSGEIVVKRDQIDCPLRLRCLENAKEKLDNDNMSFYCEPVGVHAYKISTFIMSSSQCGLVTPEVAIDILAVAQQLEQSASCQQGAYAIKYCRSQSDDDARSTKVMPTSKDIGAGRITVPFAAAKMMAIWIMLRNFPKVIKSDSYLRQIKDDNDKEHEDFLASGDRDGGDEDAILLLRSCLEEVQRSPFQDK